MTTTPSQTTAHIDLGALPGSYLITSDELSTLLRVHPETLRTWTKRAQGPKWIKVGQQRLYRADSIIEWLEANTHG